MSASAGPTGDELLTGGRQRYATRRPVKQPYAESRFQSGDRVAQRCAGDAKFNGGSPKASVPSDRDHSVEFEHRQGRIIPLLAPARADLAC